MATKTLLTLADYAALPDDGKRCELVEGELVELTFPNWKHCQTQARLYRALSLYLERRPVGRIGNDFGFVLGRDPDTLRGPDLFFVTHERASRIDPQGWMEGAPDLAVEVISPSNARREIQQKIAHYRQGAARMIWIIDPDARHVRVVDSDGRERILSEEEDLTAPDLLPGFSVSVPDVLDA